MSRQEIKNIINKLTAKQQDVLGMIAINQAEGHPSRTLESLHKKGLLEFKDKTLKDKFGILKIKVYYVPLHVHIAWCEWCAENF